MEIWRSLVVTNFDPYPYVYIVFFFFQGAY